MGLMDHATGGVNYILGGDGRGCGVWGGYCGKGHSSRHGWMIHGGQESGPQNDYQKQRENWSHLQMRRGGGQEYDHHIGCHCCHYCPCHHQMCHCHWEHVGRDHGHVNDHPCGGSLSLLSGMPW